MTDTPAPIKSSPEMTSDEKIARLERRLSRERQARRQAEEIADRGMRELWLTNRSLDQRVEERTADLEATLAKLQVASGSRQRFLATLSHEMRTPLNGILGMLELLTPHTSGEQAQTYLGTARESADRLHQLLARLLDLVDLETGSLRPDLRLIAGSDLADSIRDRWQLRAMRGGHLLTVSSHLEDQSFLIDDDRVSQIVDELLDNTTTHANRGAVRVVLHHDEDQLVVSVSDSGPGIDPELIEGLFSDFSMLDDSTARAHQGLGLGLGLSRRISQAMGGDLVLDSDGETYSTATLTVLAKAPIAN